MKRVIFCAVLMAWSTLASAVVYKWVDAQGKTLYGDRPPDGVHAEVVEGLGRDSHPAASSPASAAAAPAAPAAPVGAAQPSVCDVRGSFEQAGLLEPEGEVSWGRCEARTRSGGRQIRWAY